MADIENLKRLVEDCDIDNCADEEERDRNLNEFYLAIEPEDVAALIAENEALALQAMNHEQAARYWRKRFDEDTTEAIDLLRSERDQLKAENERLRQIISDSATACGAAMSAECSVEFMGHLPAEIAGVFRQLRAELERARAEGLGRPALERVQSRLKAAGAVLPAPEASGTTESAMLQGLCIALCLVEEEIAAMGKGGAQNGTKTAETRASAGLEGGAEGGKGGRADV